MIYGSDTFKQIVGIEKVLMINRDFSWNDVVCINEIRYFIRMDEYGDDTSYLEILFGIQLPNKEIRYLNIEFGTVNDFEVTSIGGSYNQISGFEIVDRSNSGWEESKRYVVRDYEDGKIEFSCKEIRIISIQ